MLKSVCVVALAAFALQPASALEEKPEVKEKLASTHPDYVRCKRLEETGSLVKKHKICKTNAEWARIRDRQSNEARDFIQNQPSGFNKTE